MAVLLELPLAIVQWTHLARLQPPRDAVEVEGVLQRRVTRLETRPLMGTKLYALAYIAHTPGDRALLAGGRGLVGLALDAQVHYVIPANRAVVHDNVWKGRTWSVVPCYNLRVQGHTPSPEGDSVPLKKGGRRETKD